MNTITVTPELRAQVKALEGNSEKIAQILIKQEVGTGLLAGVEDAFLNGLVAAVFRAADAYLDQELAGK